MNTTAFWNLIDASFDAANGDDDRQKAFLIEALVGESKQALVDYYIQYFNQIARAYDCRLWSALWLINHGAGDDSFYYFRDYWVARGSATFESTLKDPESLLDHLDERGFVPYDEMHFCGAANDAYRAQKGDEFADLEFDYQWPADPTGEFVDRDDDGNLNEGAIRAELPRVWRFLKDRGDFDGL